LPSLKSLPFVTNGVPMTGGSKQMLPSVLARGKRFRHRSGSACAALHGETTLQDLYDVTKGASRQGDPGVGGQELKQNVSDCAFARRLLPPVDSRHGSIPLRSGLRPTHCNIFAFCLNAALQIAILAISSWHRSVFMFA
jgi:hypothetical protein